MLFKYNEHQIKVVPSYVYPGVLLHWLESATAAGIDRDSIGWKAFGSISASLKGAPFGPSLPFHLTKEVVVGFVEVAYLSGSELWGAFVSLFPKHVVQSFSSWLLGFGSKPSVERLLGWVELRDGS